MSTDVHVVNHGTIFLVDPLTQAARDWINDHVEPNHQTWGRSIVVEHRYIADLLEGMRRDGLEVS